MEKRSGIVYLVDDQESMRLAMSQWLELDDFSVWTFCGGREVLDQIDRSFEGVLVTDVRMPGMDGLELMKRVFDIDSQIPVVLITAHGDIPMAVSAMGRGAYDFIEKPFEPDILLETIRRAGERRALVLENRSLRKRLQETGSIDSRLLGTSDSIQFLKQEIMDLAPTDASVFLYGETGAGKEITARCLHELSDRSNREFVVINCGAIPEGLFESELFGHEAGAFTGATGKRIGKFERASGGTVFLDEINNMPLTLQPKVLRVLQEKEVERLGGSRPIAVDIRVISATNVDPEQACRDGSLRPDLYYRLNVARITIPPLHKRGRDIVLLFEYFTDLAAKKYNRMVEPLTSEDVGALMTYPWPGNVRELKNIAERYVLSSRRGGSRIAYLLDREPVGDPATKMVSLAEQAENFERCVLEQSLSRHQGNMSAVMDELQLPRRTLNQKMVNHGLSRKDFLGSDDEG
ncbi:sigma-54 dependent transcriptional regulator [Desulfopila sp. IMCC35008]|uniref:sigma-54-dependent transcriptional regulator n=1 Tax=Desulfopila sp. IMCC35008 TaxID=2653858 RepID=UPI0013D0B38C|nr:sigma-54 dependent transcriptional regulator [Desulfopila sp. IMCC35008]